MEKDTIADRAQHRASSEAPFRKAARVLTYFLVCSVIAPFALDKATAQSLRLTRTKVAQASSGRGFGFERYTSGKRIVLPTDVPIELHAETIAIKDGKIFTARGDVRITQGSTSVRADNVMYNLETGELMAKGMVIARHRGDVIEADKVVFSMGSGEIIVNNGKLRITQGGFYIDAEKFERVSPNSYHIKRGSITTCEGPRPDWKFHAEDLDVTVERYGVLRHGFFYIRGVPVFYLPWFFYPAKQKRQSGFLVPSVSNSTQRGFDLQLPFFINISRSMDATITPRISTKRAVQTGLEFRYVPMENLSGRMYGEYTYDWIYGSESDPKTHRFYFTWRHNHDIFNLAKFKINANWVSDRDYFDFWEDPTERRRRVRYLESNAILSKQWDNFLFQAEATYIDDLALPDNDHTVQNIPSVTGALFNQQTPYTPFYVSSNIAFDHFFVPLPYNQWVGSRMKADTRISLPISLGPYLKLDPSATHFARAYQASRYEQDIPAESVSTLFADMYQLDAKVFTDLYSIYSGPFLGFHAIKHTFRPTLSYAYRPAPQHADIPDFDETDKIDAVSMVRMELRNTFTGRLGARSYLDFFGFRISQGLDLLRAESFMTENSGDDETMNDVSYLAGLWNGLTNTMAELTVKPHTLIDLTAQAEYDPVNNRARSYGVDLGLMDHRGDMLRVFHQFTEDKAAQDMNRQTNVNLQLKLTDSLDCFVENQYSHQFDFSYFTSVGLLYHPQCWNVMVRYSESREKDPLTQRIKTPNQSVFMTLSLLGLGQVYKTSRDWRELLGRTSDAGISRSE